jgi:Zn-dependent peptidase ImmA (M78 family)
MDKVLGRGEFIMDHKLMKVVEDYQIRSIYELAEVLGITILFDLMPKDFGGLYYVNEVDSEIIIVINGDIKEQLKHFACAYLIAHHALNKGTQFCFLDENNSNIRYYHLALKLLQATREQVAMQERVKMLS